MTASYGQTRTDDLGEDWALLVNALAEPVVQLIAVEAQDEAQMREVEQVLTGMAGVRPVWTRSIQPGGESPENLWRRARESVPSARDRVAVEAASIPLLILVVYAWSPEPSERAKIAEFWGGMNQLRERWHDLSAQVIFLLSPIAYEHLTLNADHLKRWIALKVHLGASNRKLATLLRPGRALENVSRTQAMDEDARTRVSVLAERRRDLDLLARQAQEAQRRGEDPAELVRRYYLPLATGALRLGDLEQVQTWRRLIADPTVLDPQALSGLMRLDAHLIGLRRRSVGDTGAVRSDFDVFLSHNSRDKPAVRALAEELRARRIRVWLDEEQLIPGLPWQEAIESAVHASDSLAVLIGADGLGPWEDEEMRAAISLAARDRRPVIPALLPDAPAAPKLPLFLADRTWVDLRPAKQTNPASGSPLFDPEGLDRLVWGITGRPPGADIFISYAYKDGGRVASIAKAIESLGFSVCWDIELPTGRRWADEIEQALAAARCVLVVWTANSVGSQWVRAEAAEALDADKLVPVFLEPVKPPLYFRHVHGVDLSNWDGRPEHGGFQRLIRDIAELAGPRGPAFEPRKTEAKAAGPEPLTSFRDRLQDGSEGPEMVWLPPGCFLMGSPDVDDLASDEEMPQHEVRIARPFAIGRFPVTFDEYDRFCAATGREHADDRGWGRGRRPAINCSWEDAAAYCEWLIGQTGRSYRLPSEAEWEYACRAGTQTRWSFGDKEKVLGDYGWFSGNAGARTHPVGEKRPNPWGLYDLHGNVWEWVQDYWYGNYQGAPEDGSAWENAAGKERVGRGGGWFDYAGGCRSAQRIHWVPVFDFENLGFRLAREPGS